MKALFAKLLKVQEKVKAVVREESNPAFKSKYYDINGLLAELKPVLNEVGIVVLQPLASNGDKTMLQTTVLDPESGEQLSWQAEIPPMNNIQQTGACISYMRRYALSSLFLLEAEDNDGEGAKKKSPYDVALDLVKKAKADGNIEKKTALMERINASTNLTVEQKKALSEML